MFSLPYHEKGILTLQGVRISIDPQRGDSQHPSKLQKASKYPIASNPCAQYYFKSRELQLSKQKVSPNLKPEVTFDFTLKADEVGQVLIRSRSEKEVECLSHCWFLSTDYQTGTVHVARLKWPISNAVLEDLCHTIIDDKLASTVFWNYSPSWWCNIGTCKNNGLDSRKQVNHWVSGLTSLYRRWRVYSSNNCSSSQGPLACRESILSSVIHTIDNMHHTMMFSNRAKEQASFGI